MYWDQGWDSVKYSVKECAKSWQCYNPDWTVRLVDRFSVLNYIDVDELPRWCWDTPGPDGFWRRQRLWPRKFNAMIARSDFIRAFLVYKLGGVYVDCNTWCNSPLDEWVFDAISPVGFFSNYINPRGYKFEHQFYAGEPGNFILEKFWYNGIVPYWTRNGSAKIYRWAASVFDRIYRNNEEFKKEVDNVPRIQGVNKCNLVFRGFKHRRWPVTRPIPNNHGYVSRHIFGPVKFFKLGGGFYRGHIKSESTPWRRLQKKCAAETSYTFD